MSNTTKLDEALALIKGLPGYPAAQLKVIEGTEEIEQVIAPTLAVPALPSAQRLEYAIRLLDNMASQYSSLVNDQRTFEAFQSICWGLECRAWIVYRGATGIQPLENNKELQVIKGRLRHWTKEALRRWSDPEKLSSAALNASTVTPRMPRAIREPDYALLRIQTFKR